MWQIAAIFLLALFSRALLCVAADPIDQEEAKRRGVPVEQVEIEKLKSYVASLEVRNKDLETQLAGKKKELVSCSPE